MPSAEGVCTIEHAQNVRLKSATEHAQNVCVPCTLGMLSCAFREIAISLPKTKDVLALCGHVRNMVLKCLLAISSCFQEHSGFLLNQKQISPTTPSPIFHLQPLQSTNLTRDLLS